MKPWLMLMMFATIACGRDCDEKIFTDGSVLVAYSSGTILIPSSEFLERHLGPDRGPIYYSLEVGVSAEGRTEMVDNYFQSAGRAVILRLPAADVPIPLQLYDSAKEVIYPIRVDRTRGLIEVGPAERFRLPPDEPRID